MFKQIIDLGGNEWYLILSLWIFFVFFVFVAIWLLRMRKPYSDYMSQLPLENEKMEKEQFLD